MTSLPLIVFLALALIAVTYGAKVGGKPKPQGGPNHNKKTRGLIGGDMRMKKGNGEDRNAVSDEDSHWDNGVVPYTIRKRTYRSVRDGVEEAIKYFNTLTCVKFVPRKNEEDYIEFKSNEEGCWADLGRTGGKQLINLQRWGCEDQITVLHEMLHALGFDHEHNRSDRDKYVKINWQNVEGDQAYNFDKMDPRNENDLNQAYDYLSIMHYDETSFGKKTRNTYATTIVAKEKKYQKIMGRVEKLSAQDIKEVKLLYKCPGAEDERSEEGEKGDDCYDIYDSCPDDVDYYLYYEDDKCDETLAEECPLSCNAC